MNVAMFAGDNPLLLNMPNSPGTYALIIRFPECQTIQVGRLGQFHFSAGVYLYIGSALGPGGLAGRLKRHLRLAEAASGKATKRHWHIDYLWPKANLEAILYSQGTQRQEHIWASWVGQLPGVTIPVPRFGASDCRCPSHLFCLATAAQGNQG